MIVRGPRARRAIQDVEVGGVLLSADDLVPPNASAAAFDPTVYPDPYRLDVARQRSPTLTFGFGAHYCQAAQLARMTLYRASVVHRTPTRRTNKQLRRQKVGRIFSETAGFLVMNPLKGVLMDRGDPEVHVTAAGESDLPWHVSVDRDRCVSSGQCISNAFGYFQLVDGYSQPVSDNVAADPVVSEAAEICPAAAIRVHRTSDGALIAPQ